MSKKLLRTYLLFNKFPHFMRTLPLVNNQITPRLVGVDLYSVHLVVLTLTRYCCRVVKLAVTTVTVLPARVDGLCRCVGHTDACR